jgi:hypothetical protein
MVPTQLYKFAEHSEELTLALERPTINLVHFSERSSEFSQDSPKKNEHENHHARETTAKKQIYIDSKRTFFVPKTFLSLLCFKVCLAVQPASLNVCSSSRLAGHEHNTICWNLIPAHQFDNMTGLELSQGQNRMLLSDSFQLIKQKYLGPGRVDPSLTFEHFDGRSVHAGIRFVPTVIFIRFLYGRDKQNQRKRNAIGIPARGPYFREHRYNSDNQVKEVRETLKLQENMKRIR